MKKMHGHINPKNHQPAPLVADDVYKVIVEVCSHTGEEKLTSKRALPLLEVPAI